MPECDIVGPNEMTVWVGRSLYPGRQEVLVGADGPWVLPVAMKNPPSITLSLPVMANAKQVVVAACGVSDKYPQGKSAGMRRAVAAEDETLETFPAVGLRKVAVSVSFLGVEDYRDQI